MGLKRGMGLTGVGSQIDPNSPHPCRSNAHQTLREKTACQKSARFPVRWAIPSPAYTPIEPRRVSFHLFHAFPKGGSWLVFFFRFNVGLPSRFLALFLSQALRHLLPSALYLPILKLCLPLLFPQCALLNTFLCVTLRV